jgi:hypothetical protein
MRTTLKIAAVSSIILLLFLFTTNPQSVPSIFLIVPFVLLFIIITSSVPLALSAWQLPGAKAIRVGVTIASVLVLLLGFQSLGQLTAGDVFAVVVLFSVAYFYASRLGIRFTG